MAEKARKKFTREALLVSPRYKKYQQDFLAVVLSKSEYTLAEADKAVKAPGVPRIKCCLACISGSKPAHPWASPSENVARPQSVNPCLGDPLRR